MPKTQRNPAMLIACCWAFSAMALIRLDVCAEAERKNSHEDRTNKDFTNMRKKVAASKKLFVEVLESPCMSFGGVGKINEIIFVLLRESSNAVQLSGELWKGSAADQPEVVWTDGKNILSSSDNFDASQLCVIIFSRNEVRFIDYKNKTGGIYTR
jgi:hypothetical protein